jgi:hypothetical protein
MLKTNLRIAFALFCLSCFAFGEERFGIQGIADSTFTYRNFSFSSNEIPDSQTLWNGGFTLLGSFRLKTNLLAFYEGRFNHAEGLSGTSPRLQQTRTDPVVQAYLRYSPRLAWDLNIQLGKFGTPFGEFLTETIPTRIHSSYPLIYTHRTSVNARYIPTDPAELLSYRGRGQGQGFYAFGHGSAWLPLINFSYPTGMLAFGNPGRWDYRFALVNSSVSNPLNLGTPGQRLQWIGAGGMSCFPGLHVGVSYAEGPYLDGSVNQWLPTGQSINDFKQRALGFDLQYTLHHLEVYAELIFNRFDVPNTPQPVERRVTTSKPSKPDPAIFAAFRWNQLYFDCLRNGFVPEEGLALTTI